MARGTDGKTGCNEADGGHNVAHIAHIAGGKGVLILDWQHPGVELGILRQVVLLEEFLPLGSTALIELFGKIQFFLGPGLLGELPHDAVHHLGEDLVVEPVVTAAQELDLHLSLGHHRRAFGDFHQTVRAIHHRIPGEGADIIPHAGFIRDDVGAVPPSKMV